MAALLRRPHRTNPGRPARCSQFPGLPLPIACRSDWAFQAYGQSAGELDAALIKRHYTKQGYFNHGVLKRRCSSFTMSMIFFLLHQKRCRSARRPLRIACLSKSSVGNGCEDGKAVSHGQLPIYVKYDTRQSLFGLLARLCLEGRISYPGKDEASTSISRPSFPRRCTSDKWMGPSQSKCVESRTRP